MQIVKFKGRFKKIISNKILSKVLLILTCIIVLLCLLKLFSLIFSVKVFELKGDTRYDINEIIDASGVKIGDRLYWLSEDKVAEKLISGCPHLKSVKLKRQFPNKLCFVVEERRSGWYIQVGEDFFALDDDLSVLLETYDEESLIERGLTKLILPDVNSVCVGELVNFGNDEHMINETNKIIETVTEHNIKERLTMFDLSNRFQIKMCIDGQYDVDFGDMNGFEQKIDMIKNTISERSESGYSGGTITVISSDECHFNGRFSDSSDENDDDGRGEAEQ